MQNLSFFMSFSYGWLGLDDLEKVVDMALYV